MSVLSEWSLGVATPGTAAYAVEGGYRWDAFGLGLVLEHNLWLVNSVPAEENTFPDSVLNVGAQANVTYFRDRLTSGVTAGTSTLLVDTLLTRGAGHTGIFGELQPVGIRLPLGSNFHLEIEPFTYIVMAPVLDAIPLVQSAFRTTVGLEVSL